MQAIALIFAGTLVCFFTGGASVRLSGGTSLKKAANQCVSMHGGPLSPFAACSVLGYNNTFRFHERITEDDMDLLSHTFAAILESYENCSQHAVADAIVCSMFVPKCVTSSPDPVLPCRRVCSEFLKQCGGQIWRLFYDLTLGQCEILPNKTASSGECLEPTNFKVNKSVPDPLDRKCQPLLIPACQGKDYNHTLLHVETQKELYLHLYGSNYTKENASKQLSPITELILHTNDSSCRANVEKLLCAAFFPPCFPSEGPAFYSLCQSGCQEIYDDCPSWKQDPFVDYMCTTLAEGDTSHGYCKHTKWPVPSDWIFHKMMPSRPTPTGGPVTKGGPSAGVIAAAVIVPVVLVGAFIGAAFFWKKRRLSAGVGYTKQEDDLAPLDT